MYSVGRIISLYRKKRRLSQPELAQKLQECGISISYKSISGWEKDTCEPSVTTFLTLCRILEIPDVFEEYFGQNPANPLSSLNDSGKEKVLDYIGLLLNSADYRKPLLPKAEAQILPFPKRTLRLYRPMVSAGTGNFLDSGDFDLLEVGEEVPSAADFGVQLSGDSMEPKYVHHQIVWVHQQDTLQDGEIGIFYYDGKSFCKQLRKDDAGVFLISLNQNYAPIPVLPEEEFRVFGKVIG